MQFESSRYFSDQQTPIDYILVYNKPKLTQENTLKLENFLKTLLDVGFKAEIQAFSVSNEENSIFALTHVTNYYREIQKGSIKNIILNVFTNILYVFSYSG